MHRSGTSLFNPILGAAITTSLSITASAAPVSSDYDADGAPDYPVALVGYDAADPAGGVVRLWSGAPKTIIDDIFATETNTLFGWSTGSAGDINGDGHDDFIVGEPLWSASANHEGRFQVFSGADRSVLLSVTGPYIDTGLGRYVTGIGDWNGDTVPDIAASGWDIADTDSNEVGDDPVGIVFVFSGADGSVLNEIFEPTGTERFAYSIFGLGDVTGDGLADIAVTDPRTPGAPGSGAKGALYVWSGTSTAGSLSLSDAHRTILNDAPSVRGFAAQVDVMDVDLWLNEATIQVISLTDSGVGGTTQAESQVDVFELDGTLAGSKGIKASLVLAGDVNLDGVVTTVDVQISLDEMGAVIDNSDTPPIVDTNGDGIVDTFDIVTVLNAYGDTTDIYQGLEDPGRLLSVVAGASGFGRTPNNLTGGSNNAFGGGRRPTDECITGATPPDDGSTSLVRYLLRLDARTNCTQCATCSEIDQYNAHCFECSAAGNMSGGQVSASPSQPQPGETVTFTISDVVVTGRTQTCSSTCGSEATQCSIDVAPTTPAWVIERKDASGNWIEIRHSNEGLPPETTQSACAEVRLRTLPYTEGAIDQCEALTSQPDEASVQFADFEYKVTCYADGSERKRVGVKEIVKIELMPEGVTGIARKISGPGSAPTRRDGGRYFDWTAPVVEGDTVIELQVGDCVRQVTFTTVLPDEIIMHQQPGVFHDATEASAGLKWCIQVGPLDVSFRYIYLYEGTEIEPPETTGGLNVFSGWSHSNWSTNVGCDNFAEDVDGAYSGSIPPPGGNPNAYVGGTFDVELPWHWKSSLVGTIRPSFDSLHVHSTLTSNGTMTHSKGTLSVTIPFGGVTTGLPWAGATCPMYNEPTSNVVSCQ